MRRNRTFIVILVVLFFFGLMISNGVNLKTDADTDVGAVDDESVEEPGNDYEQRIEIEHTSNLFVRIAKIAERLINLGINALINFVQRLFGMIFGT